MAYIDLNPIFHNQDDQGRFEVTGENQDRMRFKVAQLRNVAVTGPYFHDGSVALLEEAVRIMARIQLAPPPAEAEVAVLADEDLPEIYGADADGKGGEPLRRVATEAAGTPRPARGPAADLAGAHHGRCQDRCARQDHGRAAGAGAARR